jgi:hypothetical protein
MNPMSKEFSMRDVLIERIGLPMGVDTHVATTVAEQVADNLLSLSGDADHEIGLAAIREIFDRVDGLATASVPVQYSPPRCYGCEAPTVPVQNAPYKPTSRRFDITPHGHCDTIAVNG